MELFRKIRLPYREDPVFGTLALAVFAVPLVFSLFTEENFEVLKLSLTLVLVGTAWLLWLKERFQSGSGAATSIFAHKPFFLLLGLFLLSVGVSSVLSYDVRLSVFGLYPRLSGSLIFFAAWAAFTVLLFMRADRERWRYLAGILCVDAAIMAVASLLQSYGIGYYEGPDAPAIIRAPGLLGNPNFTSMFMVAVLPLVLQRLIGSGTLKKRLAWGIAAFCILWASVSLTSRGALLGLGVAAVVLLAGAVLRRSLRRYAAVFAAAAIAVLLMTYVNFDIARPGNIAQTLNTSERNIDLRVYSWGLAVDAMREFPLFGTGPATFQIFAEHNQEKQMASEYSMFDDAHNMLLQLGATAGPLAALLMSVMVGMALYIGIRQYWRQGDAEALAAVASLAAFMAAAAFTPVPIACYLVLGVLLVGLVMYESRPAAARLPRAAMVPLGLAAAALAGWGLVVVASDAFYHQGRSSYFRGEFERAYRYNSLAVAINPYNQTYMVYRIGSALKLGHPEEPVHRMLDRAVALHPESASTYDRVAGLYSIWFHLSGKPELLDKAEQALLRGISLERFRALRYRRLGLLYYQYGKLDESKEQVKTALALDEKQLPGWVLLARIYQLQDNRPAMMFALEKAFKLFPEVPQTKRVLEVARETEGVKDVPINLVFEEGRLE